MLELDERSYVASVDSDAFHLACGDLRRRFLQLYQIGRKLEGRVLPCHLLGFVVELATHKEWLQVFGALKLCSRVSAMENLVVDEVAQLLCNAEQAEARIELRCRKLDRAGC